MESCRRNRCLESRVPRSVLIDVDAVEGSLVGAAGPAIVPETIVIDHGKIYVSERGGPRVPRRCGPGRRGCGCAGRRVRRHGLGVAAPLGDRRPDGPLGVVPVQRREARSDDRPHRREHADGVHAAGRRPGAASGGLAVRVPASASDAGREGRNGVVGVADAHPAGSGYRDRVPGPASRVVALERRPAPLHRSSE